MKLVYNYFDPSKMEPQGIKNALQILKEEKLTIDASHLHLLEAAEKGVFNAMCELAQAFSDGNIKGIPRNYKMSRYYTDQIIRINESTDDAAKAIVNGYRNSGLLERNFGNTEKAIEEFIKAIKIMCDNLAPHDWDYDVQYYLWQLTAGKDFQ